MGMVCEQVREAISAALDGEPGPLPESAVSEHLAACESCRSWAVEVESLHRRARVSPAPTVPDLTASVLAAVDAHRARTSLAARRRPVRLALAAVGLGQLALAGPQLLLGHDYGAPLHLAHEIGSFSVAIAFGLVLAAYRPRLAAGMVPILGIVAGLLLLTAGTDLALGRTQLSEEAPHLLELSGFLLLWRLAKLGADAPGPTPLLLALNGPTSGGSQPGEPGRGRRLPPAAGQ
jgi:predicted anti-sigma-YlaC factor YlaD